MRKKQFAAAICLSFCANHLSAQPSLYTTDLQALDAIIRKLPSFKDQIKGEKKKSYENLLEDLMRDTVSSIEDYRYFYNLSRLIQPIRDNHIGFYQLPERSRFQSKETMEAYIQSAAFRQYPAVQLNLDSLRAALQQQSIDSITGVYYYGSVYTMGLYRSQPGVLTGVILQSNTPLWKGGQIVAHLYQADSQSYKAVYAHPVTKNYIYQPVEKYRHASLLNSFFYASFFNTVYKRDTLDKDHVNLPVSGSLFDFTSLSNNVQYLLVKSFQANSKTMQQSVAFLDSIKHKLTAAFLVLDLRNNHGGAAFAAKPYYQLLKEYVRRGKLYVLINNGTLSQAELLLLQLKELPNVIVAGQTSRGMLSYGSNYGRTELLPSGQFQIYITDMRSGSHALSYEDKGISPDIFLDDQQSWLEQVLRLIDKQQN